MSTILWKESWTLGIDPIDAEHQELVNGINQLASRFSEDPGEGGESLAGSHQEIQDSLAARHLALMMALDDLANLARRHFQHEEALMRAIDYPELASHSSEHALLVAEYVEMVRELERQYLTRLDAETLHSLHRWLVSHMVGADKAYADHYFKLLGLGKHLP